MITLYKALNAWQSPDFENILKHEIEQLDANLLPLQQGLSQSNYAKTDKFSIMILNVSEIIDSIEVKAGVFYTGLITGCSCADDPTPDSEYTEYCEVLFKIDKDTAETAVKLNPE